MTTKVVLVVLVGKGEGVMGDEVKAIADALAAIIEATEGVIRAAAQLPDAEMATSVTKAIEAGHFSLQEAQRRLGR